MASTSYYANLKSAISNDGVDTRVEVNQRALIDKILARYATPGAVYRELIQNSNDADATVVEIVLSTAGPAAPEACASTATSSLEDATRGGSGGGGGKVAATRRQLVTQVIYRNNGLPFRSRDWDRLRKIAEGNPDETKVGAFGVGAYTMFSICEEPMVVSGGGGGGGGGEKECMAFYWKGDSLWTKTGKTCTADESEDVDRTDDDDDGGGTNNHISTTDWTSFIMPSRDPYPLPDMIEFGQFLAASLTFTKCLETVRVYVDRKLELNVRKTIVDCCPIVLPKASSWWKNDGAITTSSTGMFTFVGGGELTQTSLRLTVSLRSNTNANNNGKNMGTMENASVLARYASAKVKTSIPTNVEGRMVRVTKKKPPKELTVQILLDSVNDDDAVGNDNKITTKTSSYVRRRTKTISTPGALLIVNSFAPVAGCGRIFIGFRTSQTTGLGIHVSAPLLPTVEREAIDFVDTALREYNCELLEICGMLTRLVLENAMGQIGLAYEAGRDERDKRYLEELEMKRETTTEDDIASTAVTNDDDSSSATGKFSEKSTSLSSSLFGFASYMARGVKNTVTEMAIRPVQAIIGEDDETMELLNPRDDRIICTEERDAILLMRAYCPRPSTPDSLVGTCLARGFTRCLPASSPPVLTAGGVIRGSDAKLPCNGIEAFGFTNVVRRIMFENATEYHELIVNVKRLSMENLVQSLSSQILDEKMIIRLLKWWPKICRVDRSVERYGIQLRDAIKFEVTTNIRASRPSSATKKTAMTDDGQLTNLCRMDSILYVTPKYLHNLPLPETTFPPWLQNKIGLRTLENSVFRDWFTALPFDIWTSFISYHPCLVKGTPEEMNILVLSALGKHFDSLDNTRRFVELLPLDKIVIPFDDNGSSSVVSKIKMTSPKELYLPTSDLSAFEGVGVFNKVSNKLSKAGVSDSFLLALGVRNAISIEFLFLHLDTLRWNTNPKPLVKYLLNADLSPADMGKLRTTQYLPAENHQDHVYSPSELHFQREDLEIFPFVRFLQWPSSEGMANAERHFLSKLGVRVDPALNSVIQFMDKECTKEGGVRDWRVYDAALTFLTQRLGPTGIYEKEYLRQYTRMRLLPCIRQNLENGEVLREMQSPSSCYYNPSALFMGFSTLDPQLDTIHIATRTQCSKDPSCKQLINRLNQIVDITNTKFNHFRDSGSNADECERLNLQILSLFEAVFAYLSTRNDFEKSDLIGLAKKAFIPCLTRGNIEFLPPAQIFFTKEKKSDDANDVLTGKLFKQIKYNAFLSLVGVKTEPTLAEIFELVLEKPDQTLDLLGECSYKSILHRIAANPPFVNVTNRISSCPFLLGYLVVDEEAVGEDKGKEQRAQYVLARAEDIYIVDNSFLRRQFPMLVAPMEQTLEDFYHFIGSRYVSEVVKKDFELQGRTYQNTALTMSLANRLRERRSLLLSPTNSSRPLATNAAKMIDEQNLEVVQVDVILGKYTFERSSKHLKVTCCCKLRKNTQLTTLYVTTNPDWFDIASAIGAIILQRCQLEDALLLSQLLESPLETLRYRGFPVDRILRTISKPQPKASLPSPPLHMPSLQSSPPTQSLEAKTHIPQTGSSGEEGFETILHQMFPHCPIDAIQDLLGKNPTQEKVREVADFLASMPPTEKDEPTQSSLKRSSILDNKDRVASSKTTQKKKPGLMGKVLRGLPSSLLNNHNTRGGKMKPPQVGEGAIASQRTIQELNDFSHTGAESKTPASPERDASTQKLLENMLSRAVQASQVVDDVGVRSPETILNHLPHGLDRGSDGCEVIPAQNIQPFVGPHGISKTRNGIRVFVTMSSSPTFITENFSAVEDFAVIVQHLAAVFQLNLATVAIYYDSNGTTIAFNADKSLYFNLRYYCALHQNKADIAMCYSYWYLTFAHELAHNLVTAHNKEHGSFTESIAALYLPQFAKMLSQL